MIELIKARMRACGLTCQRMDELCNFGSGYTGKVLGGAQTKGVGMVGFMAIAETLGIKAVFVVNEALTEQMREHWAAPVNDRIRASKRARIGEKMLERVLPAVASEMGRRGQRKVFCSLSAERAEYLRRKGGLATAARPSEQRSNTARIAACARAQKRKAARGALLAELQKILGKRESRS